METFHFKPWKIPTQCIHSARHPISRHFLKESNGGNIWERSVRENLKKFSGSSAFLGVWGGFCLKWKGCCYKPQCLGLLGFFPKWTYLGWPYVSLTFIKRRENRAAESSKLSTSIAWHVNILLMEEILHQLRLAVYPSISSFFLNIPGGCLGFGISEPSRIKITGQGIAAVFKLVFPGWLLFVFVSLSWAESRWISWPWMSWPPLGPGKTSTKKNRSPQGSIQLHPDPQLDKRTKFFSEVFSRSLGVMIYDIYVVLWC